MKMIKRIAPICLAAAMGAIAVMPVWAYTDVTRSDEEWAKLEDNVMEYGELAALIHEYNVTVLNNRADYFKVKNRTKQEISDNYRSQAQNMYDSIQYPDGSDETAYAMAYANAVQLEAQAKSLEQLADDNVDDGEIKKIQYDQVEATLVSAAQTSMNSYQQLLLNKGTMEANLEVMRATYNSVVTQASNGMVTQADVLAAEEQVKSLEAKLINLDASIKKIKQSLCLMTGWSYNADPEIMPIPSADVTRIASMNPAADLEKAKANNYTLRAEKRKLNNTESASSKENLERTIKNEEQNAGAALNNQYQTVIQAQLSYNQALTEFDLETKNMQKAQIQLGQGMISPLDFKKAQAAYIEKEAKRYTSELALIQAMDTYDWAVAGLLSLGQ